MSERTPRDLIARPQNASEFAAIMTPAQLAQLGRDYWTPGIELHALRQRLNAIDDDDAVRDFTLLECRTRLHVLEGIFLKFDARLQRIEQQLKRAGK